MPPFACVCRAVLVAVAAALLPAVAAAQSGSSSPQDLSGMSLQDLLKVEVVSTASKFPQAIKEAPASITVITAEDIRRFGYRTLAEALRSVRGFYTTYDRNYTYVGLRGFARPGDYNTRVLLLVDGHKLNDGIYDMAPVGTDFLIDLPLVDRIEVIRGPGSSLYGTNAVFGIINVVTRSGGGLQGARVEGHGGSLGTVAGLASYGRALSDGREVLMAGSLYQSDGPHRLYYPEFDTDTSDGMAVGLDGDQVARAFGSLSAGRFSIRGALVNRKKHVPTASFDSVFGDDRLMTKDNRAFLSAVYDGPLVDGWVATARLSYDYYAYTGNYPYDYGEDGINVFEDLGRTNAATGEFTARRRLGRIHLLTAGTEVRHNIRSQQIGRDLYGDSINSNVPTTTLGLYVQDELRPASWLLVNAGVRVDRLSTYGLRTTPRVGVVLMPGTRTAVKLLHGTAFRAPNAYERYYYNEPLGLEALEPEQIRSSEVVWEQLLSKFVRTTATAFVYDVDRIIEQRVTAAGEPYFANAGQTRGRGVEGEVEARFDNGLAIRVSHTFTQVQDRVLGTPVSNSPENITKAAFQYLWRGVALGLDGQYVGERLTIGGDTLPGFFVPSVTVTSPERHRLGANLSIYNIFNHIYADPGAEEHVQSSIEQDGRTVLLRIFARF